LTNKSYIHFAEICAVNEYLDSSSLCDSLTLLRLLLSPLQLFFIALLDFLCRKIIWILFNRLLSLPEPVSLGLVRDLSRPETSCKSNPLDLVIVIFELL